MLLSETKSSTGGKWYIFSNDSNVIAIGRYVDGAYQNYGMKLSSTAIDWNGTHTWRLENRIAGGTNMVYLLIDGNEICAMNNYYKNSSLVTEGDNSLAGVDLEFNYFGSGNKPLDTKLHYLQVWSEIKGHEHDYKMASFIVGDCVTKASVTYVCACGDTYIEIGEVDPENHTGNNEVRNAVTAGCLTDGYSGDTYCECGELITKGEVIPATGEHNFATEVAGSKIPATCTTTGTVTMVCTCGEQQQIERPIDPENHAGETILKDATDATCGWDGYTGDTYCGCGEKLATGEVIPATGLYYCWATNCELPCNNYEFAEDGKMLQGIVQKPDGPYYYVNGRIKNDKPGLTKIGDAHYFVSSIGRCAVGEYYCWATNCDLPVGPYEFGTDGKMLQSIVQKEDGPYLYTNGRIDNSKPGLTKIGDDYYFVSAIGRCAVGSYFCWATNCDLPCGLYEFDAEGKMVK